MAKITWLGEDHLHEEGNGPSRNVWNGVMFKQGEAVEVDSAHMIAKAKANHFYKVEEEQDEKIVKLDLKPSKPVLSLPEK